MCVRERESVRERVQREIVRESASERVCETDKKRLAEHRERRTDTQTDRKRQAEPRKREGQTHRQVERDRWNPERDLSSSCTVLSEEKDKKTCDVFFLWTMNGLKELYSTPVISCNHLRSTLNSASD